MILIDAKAQTYTSANTSVGDAKSVFIHVYSASTSTATVVIEQSLDGNGWVTAATITNPSSTGELWRGPSLPLTRVRISAYTSGTITATADFAQAEVSTWANAAGTTGSYGLNFITYSWTNSTITAGAGGTSIDVTLGTIPAKSQILTAYAVVDTQATFAAGTLTVSVGRTGTAYADFLAVGDLKAAAGTIYGNAAAERATDAAIIYLASATALKAQFLAGAGDLANVTGSTGTIRVGYITFPA